MQGWRTGMEDSHLACLDLRRGKSNRQGAGGTSAGTTDQCIAAFAVFDGHVSRHRVERRTTGIFDRIFTWPGMDGNGNDEHLWILLKAFN